jgi:hypothetical protein
MNTSVQNQALTSTPTPIRPNTRFVKASDILSLFEITKSEYNNILVRKNNIILNNFIILLI